MAWRRRAPIGSVVGFWLVTSASEVWAGAWTLEAGTGQVIVTAVPSSATQGFDASRGLTSIPRYDKFELTGLVEYGATNWLTLMVSPQFQHIEIAPPFEAQRTGLGYTEAGARAKLYDWDSWVISMQATLRLPGTSSVTNPAAIGYTDVQADIRGLVGRTFMIGRWPAFIDLEFAQRFRTDGAPDEFRADFTLGVRPAPKWLLLAQSFNVVSEGAGTWGFPSYDYYKLQLSAVYEVTPALALQLGGFTAYTGRNSIQENGVLLGAWYKF
jgi:protein XagA